MGKHAADKPHEPQHGGRMKHYAEIERDQGGPSEQSKELQQRPRGKRDAGRRAQEFTRIDRGREA